MLRLIQHFWQDKRSSLSLVNTFLKLFLHVIEFNNFFFFFLASRLAVHVIKWSKTLPDPDQFKHSVVISVIIHGSALAVINLLTYGLWISIALCGNIAHQFLFKLTQWPMSSGIVLPAIQKFPITVGFVLVSMAYSSCGGLALIGAVIMYFIILSKMYEDYLEEFVFKTAAVITEKLFGKKRNTTNTTDPAPASTPALVQLKNTQEEQSHDKSNDDKNTAATNEKAPDNKPENDDNTEKSEENETKKQVQKLSKKRKDKKVEFASTSASKSDDSKFESCEETSTSTEPLLPKSKSDLEVEEGAIVASGSQESFEVLYNQLDPNDVAMFSKRDEVQEMTEEERKEMEKAEAGLYRVLFYVFGNVYTSLMFFKSI